MSEELQFSSAVAQTTTLKIPPGGITSTSVQIDYATMNGNQPNKYKNSVAIFQAGRDLPWNQEPLKVQASPKDGKDGSFNFVDLEVQNKSYLVAYAVGDDEGKGFPMSNVCSTVFIPAGSDDESNDFFPSISIVSLGSDSLVLKYAMPSGQKPQTAKHYLALWESSAYSYNAPPKNTQPITSDQETRSQPWNGLTLLRGTTYTIAYIAGTKQTDIACALTFNT